MICRAREFAQNLGRLIAVAGETEHHGTPLPLRGRGKREAAGEGAASSTVPASAPSPAPLRAATSPTSWARLFRMLNNLRCHLFREPLHLIEQFRHVVGRG